MGQADTGAIRTIGAPAEMSQKATLKRLSHRCVTEVFDGCVLAFAEAYAEAKFQQVLELDASCDQDILDLPDDIFATIVSENAKDLDMSEELDDAMIAVLMGWLDEDRPREVRDVVHILNLNEQHLLPH